MSTEHQWSTRPGAGLGSSAWLVRRSHRAGTDIEVLEQVRQVGAGEGARAATPSTAFRKRVDAPPFQAALTRCRQLGAVLAAARPDRITRRAHTVSQSLEDGYAVRAADMPGADDLTMRVGTPRGGVVRTHTTVARLVARVAQDGKWRIGEITRAAW